MAKLKERVKMYGTESSKFHKPGEETLVDPAMVDHFEKRGLSKTKPAVKTEGDDKGTK